MVTVVNTPPTGNNDSGSGWLVGVVLLVLLVLVVLFWGGPVLRRIGSQADNSPSVDVNIDAGEETTTNEDNSAPALPDLNINQDQENDNEEDNDSATPAGTSTGTGGGLVFPTPTGQ
jgi:Na+-transporting methylmalonyl-CoA/oxaloacetate decarboxylase gamma subunit